jgi:hypothetical protein
MAALVPIPGETGRPYTLSEDARARLLDALRLGTPREFAARAAGVGWSSLKKWLATARKPNASAYFRALLADVERAEAECVARNVGLVNTAAATTWQAAAWWLERRHPRHFARQDTTVVKASRGGVVYVNGVTQDEVRGQAAKPPEG